MPTGARSAPRSVVAHLLHYKDRDILIKNAHNNGPYVIANSKVSIFSDYTAKVQAQRASFTEAKKALRTEGIMYSLIYLATLRVILDGATIFFDSPEELWS